MNCRQKCYLPANIISTYERLLLWYYPYVIIRGEIFSKLYNQAKENHHKLKLTNINHILGNGIYGCNKNILFDAIIISAATESCPNKLLESLKNGGKIIFPKKYDFETQKLKLLEKINKNKYITKTLFDVRFVPLLNKKST